MLFRLLPDYLARMALFKVNTGCREQEVCRLRWDWEVQVPEIGTSVFLIPNDFGGRSEQSGVKNGEDRLVVLNDVAKSVIEAQRGKDPAWVFPYKRDRPLAKMNDTAWKSARKRAAQAWQQETNEAAAEGYRRIRVHVLVGVEMRQRRARRAQAPDLRREFLLDFVERHASREARGDERLPRMAETSLTIDERRNVPWRQDRPAVNQREVAADAERGALAPARDRVVGRGRGRNQAGARQHAAPVRVEDPTVHADREAEVVRVDDEPARHALEAHTLRSEPSFVHYKKGL